MRKQLVACFSCLLVLLGSGVLAGAATVEKLFLEGSSHATAPSCKVVTADGNGVTLELEIPYLDKEAMEVEGTVYQLLSIPGGGFSGESGEAALPTFTRLVAIPDYVGVKVRVTNQHKQTLTGMRIAPHQPSEAEQFVKDAQYYARQGLDETPQVSVGQPALLRGLRVVPVTFKPVRYDPSRQEVEVSRRLTVELSYEGSDPTNAVGKSQRFIPESFYNLYREVVVNFDTDGAEVGPGSYLVICPDNSTIIDAVQPLLDWRRRQGYNVILVTTAQTGTANTQIKSYIQTAYNNWQIPLEHVVLVGDATGSYSVATWFEGLSGYNGEGDHYYTNLAGADVLSDINIGRLSHRSYGELQTIVAKIVNYESDPWLTNDPGWFTRATLVADPYSQSGWSTVFISQWCKNQLLDLGYTQIDTIFGGNFATLMQSSFNQGGTILTYRGYLNMSGYTTSHIDALSNGEKLHYAVVLTCGTGSFSDDSHSRSEAFLRSANGGGVAAIGLATWGTHTRYNNCLFNGLMEGILNSGDFRVGPSQVRGKLEMYLNYGSSEPHEVEIWSVWNTLMGDPVTDIWTAYPKELVVAHPATVAVGTSSVTLGVEDSSGLPVPGAKVALYKAGEILVSGYADAAGQVILPLTGHTAGTLQVTVTKHNWQPYLGSIALGSVSTYLSSGGTTVDDDTIGMSDGNGDGAINPGETIEWNVEIQNLGSDTAGGVTAMLTSPDPHVTMITGQQSFGDIGPGSSVWQSFVFSVDSGAPGGQAIPFVLEATSGADSWTTSLEANVVGGACRAFPGYTFGGPGGTPDPGESGSLTIDLFNEGNADITGITATLASETPWVTVSDPNGNYGFIGIEQTGVNSGDPFEITITGDCYQGHLATFTMYLEFASGALDTTEFLMSIGSKSVSDPVGPDKNGYYAFDNTDVSYQFAPTYDWVEIDPSYGGSGTSLGMSDNGTYQDETVVVDLPFSFQFYGQNFDKISVCSNGWFCMGASYLVLYRNWTLPNAGGPDDLVAVFWDNLYMSTSSDVVTWYDPANHRFIVEWSQMRNDMDGSEETFQAILYDPAHYPTDSGDGRIVCQYETVNQVDWKNGYATVGIQNTDHSDGLLYTYWNRNAPGAASLVAGRAIAYHSVLAQPQGYLEGDVTNTSGGGSPVAGAVITVVESGRIMTSQESGHYYGGSPPGLFTVTVSHESFAPDVAYEIDIAIDTVTLLDFALTDILGPYLNNVTTYPGTEDTVGPYEIQVNITDYSPIDQMQFFYTSSSDGGRAHELPLQLLDSATGLYKAEIPGQPLGTRVQYWLTASDIAGNRSAAPTNAPWDVYSFMVGAAQVVLEDAMETDQGWTVGDTGDDATTGIWERVDPNGIWEGGTPVQPEDDATPDPGYMCWITGNDPPGSIQGTDDVDGGKTTLLSPWFDLSGYQGVSLTYKRWYSNNTGNDPNTDYWTVQVTDDGSQWVNMENTNLSNQNWFQLNFALESYVTLTTTVRLRFIASDEGAGSVVEAGLDDFVLTGNQMLNDTAPPTVALLDPDGGESLPRGQPYEIRWDAGDDIGVVMTHILFSTDGGSSFPDTVASGTLDSTYVWQVPDMSATTCRIKVVVFDAVQNETSDISTADFAITGATDVASVPAARLALAQNRPNPFNPRTAIRFSLPAAQHVSLRIYDVEGRLVRTLVDEQREAGPHSVVWSGADNSGARTSSGLYFYRLTTETGQVITRKMLLVK